MNEESDTRNQPAESRMQIVGKALSGNLIVEISLAELSRAYPDRRFVIKKWEEVKRTVDVEDPTQPARCCQICGGPISPMANARRTICDKEPCSRERQRRASAASYARLNKPGKAAIEKAHAGPAKPTALDKASRLEFIRRAAERLSEAELHGGRIPNRRNHDEAFDVMEA